MARLGDDPGQGSSPNACLPTGDDALSLRLLLRIPLFGVATGLRLPVIACSVSCWICPRIIIYNTARTRSCRRAYSGSSDSWIRFAPFLRFGLNLSRCASNTPSTNALLPRMTPSVK